MVKRIAVVLAVVLATAGLAGPVAAAAAVAPTISGPALVPRSSTVTIAGHAAAGATVEIWFHRSGRPAASYSLRRLLTADSTGGYRTTYVADTDYRYYARSHGITSAAVLTQVTYVTMTGPWDAVRGSRVVISGTVHPTGAAVAVYFHRAGRPAGDYSLRRSLRPDRLGRWSTSYLADADYRYYATYSGTTSAALQTVLSPPWLQAINSYRQAYGLGPVHQNATLSAADAVHVRYMYLTGQLGHSEDPANQYHTATGNAAAGRSNVAGGFGTGVSDVGWVNLWMTGPFHEIGVLRPTLRTVGFAATAGALGSYAALDVLGDLAAPVPGGWPKSFPSASAAFPFRDYTRNEIPDPLTGCPAVFARADVSAPLLVSLGPAAGSVGSATATLTDDRTHAAPALCVQTESTYRNPDADSTSTGRAILGESHSIVVFAVGSLIGGSSYTLTVRPAGHPVVTVHFRTS